MIPFVLFMCLTGLPYLWQWEIEAWAHPELVYVKESEGASRLSFETQIDVVKQAFPERAVRKVQHWPQDPLRSTRIQVGHPKDLLTVYVNPYTGKVLGTVREMDRISSRFIAWHGGIPWGDPGSWIIELFACWTLVLCLTGLYLWWPRAGWKVLGVFLPKLSRGGRSFWKELHAVVGAWIAIFAIFFLATGLPWTAFWGNTLLGRVQKWMGHENQHALVWSQHFRSDVPPENGPRVRVPVDAIISQLQQKALTGHLDVFLPQNPEGVYKAFNPQAPPQETIHFQFDQYSGSELAFADWEGKSWTAKAVAMGVSIHEGKFLGLPNQWINTFLCALLMLISLAAIPMWWLRKPLKSKALPSMKGVPKLFGFYVVCCAVIFPMFGMSFLLVSLIHRILVPCSASC